MKSAKFKAEHFGDELSIKITSAHVIITAMIDEAGNTWKIPKNEFNKLIGGN